MKENKEYQIKARITKSEKERITAVCEKYKITISQFVRLAIEKILIQKENEQ